jgi:hypothetical protein
MVEGIDYSKPQGRLLFIGEGCCNYNISGSQSLSNKGCFIAVASNSQK